MGGGPAGAPVIGGDDAVDWVMGPRDRQPTPHRFSTTGLLVGTLCFALSLAPSLLPRTFAFQGLVSGLSLALGYGVGRLGRWLWGYLGLPAPAPHATRIHVAVVGVTCVIIAVASSARATAWQNELRELMGMPEAVGVRPIAVALVATAVFVVLHLLGRLIGRFIRAMIRWLDRVLPRRVAILLGVLLAGWLLIAFANGLVVSRLLAVVDGSYRQLDEVVTDDLAPPTEPTRAGSASSLLNWRDLGAQGRRFVSSGPRAAEIAAYHDTLSREPVRVYVGLHAASTPQERARLALAELQRAGGFDRAVLVLATPTGTGWLDPAAIEPLEIMHRGDVATVSAQYSYLPSPVALLTEAPLGAEVARALFEAVYGHWTTLPRGTRPRLFLHGLSLGALNADRSFDLYDIMPDPFDGALWVGPPFRTESWLRITERRDPASPAWRPRFRDGSVVRVMTQQGGLDAGGARWGPPRIVYLQYGSDPVTFFTLGSFVRRPDWLEAPRAPDVSPGLRWVPIVTAIQLAADIAAGAEAAPLGYGHNFAPRDYITAWAAIAAPTGWTAEDSRRLQGHFASYQRR